MAKIREIEPLEVKVKYDAVLNGQFPDEFIVKLRSANGLISGIFNQPFLDFTDRTINAVAVYEKDDMYLLNFPGYFMANGSKVWFDKELVAVIR